jgi:hypothetical protein
MIKCIYKCAGDLVLKNLTYAVVFTVCTGIHTTDAAYLIKLRNGNEYVTNRYWNEGTQVLFDTYGGTFGVEKSFVHKIEANHARSLPTASDRDSSEKPNLQSTRSSDQPTEEKSGRQAPLKKEKAADDPIVEEFNRLKTRSQELDGMLTGEIRELLNQITTFKNKLAKDSKLFVEYGREFNDAHELGNLVETALQTRTQ